MGNKYTHRLEFLERNPILKKHWWTRTFAAVIVGGANIHPNDWPRIRLVIYASPILATVFIVNLIFTEGMSKSDKLGTLFFVVLLLGCIPLVFTLAYGYWNRDKIDTTGGVKPDFSYLKKYLWIWASIGILVSTGVGILG